MRPMTSGGGWAAIRYTLRDGQPRRLAAAVAGHAQPRTPARPARSAWAASAAAWSTRPATVPRSARSRCRRWSPTCRTGITPEFFATLLASPQLRTLSPRELEWCGRLVDAALRRPGRHALPRHRLGRGARTAVADSCRRRRPDAQLLLRQRPVVERGRLPAAALRPAVRHQLRQQLLVLLPPGERRRPRRERSAPARRPSRWRTSSKPTCSSSSAATRRRTIRG